MLYDNNNNNNNVIWHTQLVPLPLTVSCFTKIQIGFTFLVPAHLGSPGKRAVKQVCVCVCVCSMLYDCLEVGHWKTWNEVIEKDCQA